METINGTGHGFDAASKGGMDVTISELAREALEHFHRGNERGVWALKDTAPEWVESLARDAHDGLLPDDWVFEAVVNILGELHEGEYTDGDEARDEMGETCDALVDIGTGALLEWAQGDAGRLEAANEAIEQGADTIHKALMMGQFTHLGEVFESVVSSLESELEDREGE